MSKGKINKKNNNKGAKLGVKVQPTKHQKSIDNKNVNKITQNIMINKSKTIKSTGNIEGQAKKKINLKSKEVKKVNTDESDENESSDSDIDDVVISDDEDEPEYEELSSDVDVNDDSTSDDNGIEEVDLDNIKESEKVDGDDDSINDEDITEDDEHETMELDDSKSNESELEVESDEAAEKTEALNVEMKSTKNYDMELDEITKENILVEINKRKNILSDSVIFLGNLPTDTTRQNLTEQLKALPQIININLPGKVKRNTFVSKGYAFVRFANSADATKTVNFFNKSLVNGNKISANKLHHKKAVSDITKVELKNICVLSFKNEDITDILRANFNVPVVRTLNTQYILKFENEKDALELFNKEKMNVNDHELLFNYVHSDKNNGEKKKVEKPKNVTQIKGVKRPLTKNKESNAKKNKTH